MLLGTANWRTRRRLPSRDRDENPLCFARHQAHHQTGDHAQKVVRQRLIARDRKRHLMKHDPNRLRPAAEPPAKWDIHPFAAKRMWHILHQEAKRLGHSAQRLVEDFDVARTERSRETVHPDRFTLKVDWIVMGAMLSRPGKSLARHFERDGPRKHATLKVAEFISGRPHMNLVSRLRQAAGDHRAVIAHAPWRRWVFPRD